MRCSIPLFIATNGPCIALIFTLMLSTTCSAQTPSTQPSTSPSIDAAMRRSFLRLSNADPSLREQAKVDLMGLGAAQLPNLRQLARDNAPLAPDVAMALHEIVVQVFLAYEAYPALSGVSTTASGNEGPYFLGILWLGGMATDQRLGATVDERLPGFPSHRFLRKGDMIMGILLDPDAPLAQIPNKEFHSPEDLSNAIAISPLNQNIALQVLRAGEIIQVPVKMSPRPLVAGQPGGVQNAPFQNSAEQVRTFVTLRERRADEYWHLNFDPILDLATAD